MLYLGESAKHLFKKYEKYEGVLSLPFSSVYLGPSTLAVESEIHNVYLFLVSKYADEDSVAQHLAVGMKIYSIQTSEL